MHEHDRLDALRALGRMQWLDGAQAWRAEPDEVVRALTAQGFQECKREIARTPRDGGVTGGVWQGIDPRTGEVASTVWFSTPSTPPTVFIAIDGQPFQGSSAAPMP
jgi:hypothetical protein